MYMHTASPFFVKEIFICEKAALVVLMSICRLKFWFFFYQLTRTSQCLFPNNCPAQIMSSLTTSTQGVAVSLLLCFSNTDVVKQIRRVFTSQRRQRRLRPSVCSSHTTVSQYQSTNIQVFKNIILKRFQMSF